MKTWNIIKKDVRILLSDRTALAILILMPIVLMTILGAGLSGSFESGTMVQKYKIGIVKEYEEVTIDEVIASLPFTDQMDIDLDEIDIDVDQLIFTDVLESEEIQELFTYEIYSKDAGMIALEKGDIKNLVVFPEDFVEDTLINLITPFRNEVTIEVIADPDYYIETQVTRAVFGGFQNYLNHMVNTKNLYTELALKSGLGYAALDNLEQLYTGFEEGFDEGATIRYQDIESVRTINSVEYYAMAMLSMFILFTGGQGGRMMLEEKNQFTFQRMRLTGISKWQIFLGKFVTVFVVGIVQVTAMIVYTSIVLKVDWGNWVNLIIITVFALLAVASMGTMISAITLRLGNFKVANLMESFIFQVMAFLGGSFMPLEVLPKVFGVISNFTINGLALKAFIFNMQGYGIKEFSGLIINLASITILFTIVGLYIMKDEKRWKRAEHYQIENA